ncbi:MAG TPA: hypothetical protein VMT35_05535 [Ignavibacteriaceae bacterium]|nr:hypothetical protein [Ignavibacteriaceae bacterium]
MFVVSGLLPVVSDSEDCGLKTDAGYRMPDIITPSIHCSNTLKVVE